VLHQNTYDEQSVAKRVDDYDRQMEDYYASRQSNVKITNWSQQTASAVQGKKREHMLDFLRQRGFLQR